MHGFGPVVVPGSDARLPRAVGGAGRSRSRRSSGSSGSARVAAARSARRWIPSTTSAPPTTSAGSGAPSSGCCGRARSRPARSTRGSSGCGPASRRRGGSTRSRRSATAPRSRRCSPLGEAGETRFAPRRPRPRRAAGGTPGHTRCPRYVRGAEGEVTAVRGTAPLPDIGPYAGPIEPVYCVSFDSDDVFGPGDEPALDAAPRPQRVLPGAGVSHDTTTTTITTTSPSARRRSRRSSSRRG